MTPKGIERLFLRILEQRAPKTACPSEIARALDAKDWRPRMADVRAAAERLERRGRIDVVQKGRKVELRKARGPIRLRLAAAVDRYRTTDFRKHPERYRVGRGEQGVLTAEPYKSELLPSWRFRTEAEARASSEALYEAFVAYRESDDFVGMDMARKFVQMGVTRARRYANHRSGRKYDEDGAVLPRDVDEEKARAAAVFRRVLTRIERDPVYAAARAAWPT